MSRSWGAIQGERPQVRLKAKRPRHAASASGDLLRRVNAIPAADLPMHLEAAVLKAHRVRPIGGLRTWAADAEVLLLRARLEGRDIVPLAAALDRHRPINPPKESDTP